MSAERSPREGPGGAGLARTREDAGESLGEPAVSPRTYGAPQRRPLRAGPTNPPALRSRLRSPAPAPTGVPAPSGAAVAAPIGEPAELRNRALWLLVFVGFAALIAWLARTVLAVVLASAAVAYLTDPLVSRIQARGYTRPVAILLLGVGALALLAIAGVTLIPGFAHQFSELADNITPYLASVRDRIGPLVHKAERTFKVDIPVDFNELTTKAPEYLKKLSPDMQASLQGFVTNLAGGGVQVILSVLSISLMPVFTFYLLRDWPDIVASADDLVPVRQRPLVRRLATEIDGRIGAFIRGQIFVAFILACFYTVGLLVAGIDLALSMGILSGLLFLLPYVGPAIGVTISVLLALLKYGLDWHVVVVAATYGLGQVLEGTFLTPFLVGDRVGLHPMVVVMALVVAGNLLGVWGLIIALPITASLAVLVKEVVARYRQSRTYLG